MNKRNTRWLTALVILTALAALGLVSCGNSDGPCGPGNWGCEDTNIIITGMVNPEETINVDATQDLCDSDLEEFTDHSATAELAATALTEDLPSNTLFFEKYTIEFYTETPGAPPIDTFTGYQRFSLSAGDSSSFTLTLVDLDRKWDYSQKIASGMYKPEDMHPMYVAVYTFYGKDQYGNEFGFVAQTNFRIGNYDNC